MKSIILVALALVAIAAAAPTDGEKIEIVEFQSDSNPDGSYTFSYKTSDGSARYETGVVKEVLDEENKLQRVIIVEGTYTYRDEEGNLDTTSYSADENGYSASGKSIPKAV